MYASIRMFLNKSKGDFVNRRTKNRNNRKRARDVSRALKMDSNMQKKLAGLFLLIVLALVGLAIRVTYININKGNQYSKQVLTQSQQKYGSTTLPFQRGDILDANGTVLATSKKVYNLVLDCKVVNTKNDYKEPTVRALEDLLGQDESKIWGLLNDEGTAESHYQILDTGFTITEKQAFEEYLSGTEENPLSKEEKAARSLIKGIWFEDTYSRQYPFGTLASDVLGFTYSGNTAKWGLEGYYNSVLNGVDGRRYGYFTDDSNVEQTLIEPIDGNTIVTTLDVNIQQIVEKYIAEFEEEMSGGIYGDGGAKNIGVIVMDPDDGSILAMASNDPYDPNNPRDLTPFYSQEEIDAMSDEKKIEARNEIYTNYCISATFEPGSTVKPIVMAAALENGTLTGSEVFNCDGLQSIAGSDIKCSNNSGHGQLTLSGVIEYSCNDGMMQLAEKMGVEEFIRYQKIFNFGSRTGIDVSGEASGIIFSAETMGAVELATSSFGQGFNCTMIQEAAAMCSVINGGYYYQPHLVSKILDADGTLLKNNEPVLLKQTVSTEVSAMVRSYMQAAVEEGTCAVSKVDGYSSGGKTGTAQKLPRGNGKYLVSFIGFAPANDPEVLIYVVVDEPNAEKQDDSSYPQKIAKNILTEILPYMNIFRDEAATGEDVDTTDLQEGVADLNVPEPAETKEEVTGGDTLESMGVTDEEAEIMQ